MNNITIDLPNGMPKSCSECDFMKHLSCNSTTKKETELECVIIGEKEREYHMHRDKDRHPQCPLHEPKSISDEELERILNHFYSAGFKENVDKLKQAFINQQSIIDKIEKYVIKWKNSKCVHPDANVLAVEIIQIIEEVQNVKN